ncbi:MAG: hypothetical protein K2H65_02460, partial [Bacteroidales bacterium]|nr:hypothetical protein [Bacteroidales bacterium]
MEAYKWREIFINNNIQLIMKRLFSVIALATLVAMYLVSCKPNEVKLHEDVGKIYGKLADKPDCTSEMGGDGIVFYVDGDSALVCSMNDLKYDMKTNAVNAKWERNFTWSVFGSDTVMERDTVWCQVNRSLRYFIGKEEFDSVISDRTEHFLRYNFEERDS